MNHFLAHKKNLLIPLSFWVTAIWLGGIYLFGNVHFHYSVPPGDDGIRHMSVAQQITETGSFASEVESFDPPLFHILLSTISQATGVSILQVGTWFTPILAVVSIITLYFVTRRLFGRSDLALVTVMMYALWSPQPEQIYSDGTYLNLFAAGYLLPIALVTLIRLIQTERLHWRAIALFGIFSAGVILSHSLSSIYYLGVAIALVLYWFWKHGWAFVRNRNFQIAGAWLVLLGALAWPFFLGGTVQKVLASFGLVELPASNILSADFSTDISPIPSYGDYAWFLNEFLILLACLGLVWLTIWLKKRADAVWLLLLWSAILLVGSRFSLVALPMRFARDLAIPVSLLAAIGVYQSWKIISWSRLKLFATTIFILLLAFPVINKTRHTVEYNPLIRVQAADEQAFTWISEHTQPNDVILGLPRTIVAGDWGSFISLFTHRTTIDGSVCPNTDDHVCDPIYQPTSALSLHYYSNQSIDYVYAGKIILGPFINKDKIDWTYTDHLSAAPFLIKVAEFPENEQLGAVTIFKVDHAKLSELLAATSET